MDHAEGVDAQLPLPVGGLRLPKRSDAHASGDACVVDQHVEPTKGTFGLVDHPFAVGFARHVSRDADDIAAYQLARSEATRVFRIIDEADATAVAWYRAGWARLTAACTQANRAGGPSVQQRRQKARARVTTTVAEGASYDFLLVGAGIFAIFLFLTFLE